MLVTILVATVVSWGNIEKLVDDWSTIPAYSHGFLVPFVAIFLVYMDRERLRTVPVSPSRWGVALVGAGAGLLIIGTLSGLDFLRQISILFFAGGIVSGFWGTAMMSALRFPLLYLLFMIPLPYILYNAIAFPLQMLAARGASEVLSGLTIPVFREGNIIHLPHISLGVVQACSGIQSLVSLLAISVLLTKIMDLRGWAGALFALSAIPVAVVANMFRIAATGVLGSFVNPALAEGFFHLFSGWVVFLFAFLVLMIEIRVLRLMKGKLLVA
ncbi:MAG: exosortase [Nitrospirota bacterium]|nr:exosortase [Nitrospirota bacterium]